MRSFERIPAGYSMRSELSPQSSAAFAIAAATSDPRCPAQRADLTDSRGIPIVCPVDGLICAYPQGEAECAPDGAPLK